jgi:hypothetical protein
MTFKKKWPIQTTVKEHPAQNFYRKVCEYRGETSNDDTGDENVENGFCNVRMKEINTTLNRSVRESLKDLIRYLLPEVVQDESSQLERLAEGLDYKTLEYFACEFGSQFLKDDCFLSLALCQLSQRCPSPMWVHDQLVRTLHSVTTKEHFEHDSDKMPHAAARAARIDLDSVRMLQNDAQKAYEELKQTGKHIREAIKAYVRNTSGAVREPTVEEYRDQVSKIERLLPGYFKKRLKLQGLLRQQSSAENSKGAGLPDIFEWFPQTSGVSLFALKFQLAQLAIAECDQHQTLVILSHLLNAMQNEGIIEMDWPDLEFLREVFSGGRIFVSVQPGAGEDYNKWMLFSLGWTKRKDKQGRRFINKLATESSAMTLRL